MAISAFKLAVWSKCTPFFLHISPICVQEIKKMCAVLPTGKIRIMLVYTKCGRFKINYAKKYSRTELALDIILQRDKLSPINCY